VENLQIDLNWLAEWVVENVMVINPAKSKAVCFMRARVTEPLSYSLRDIVIPEASTCKYLGKCKKWINFNYNSMGTCLCKPPDSDLCILKHVCLSIFIPVAPTLSIGYV
jgi:hypothetical protein